MLMEYSVFSANSSDEGNYTVDLIYTNGSVSYNTSFMVYVQPAGFCSTKYIYPPVIQNQQYIVEDPALTFVNDNFTSSPTLCIFMFTYSA